MTRTLPLVSLCTFLLTCTSSEENVQSVKDSIQVDSTEVIEAPTPKNYQRIVAIGSPITEILIDLEATDNLVAVDKYTTTTPVTKKLPKVGYGRILTSERVLKHRPDLVLSTKEASPNNVVSEVQNQKIDYLLFEPQYNLASTQQLIEELATLIDKKAKGQAIIDKIQEDITTVKEQMSDIKYKAKILYIFANNETNLMLAGENTPADALIQLAGAENALNNSEGLVRLTATEVTKAAPTYFLMTTQSLRSLEGRANLNKIPGYYDTTAGKMGRLILIDESELLDFGASLGTNALSLSKKIYPAAY
ncbi:MAG: hemin ABC transporter substrate-binding protein [Thermonemataceae bacterium]